MLQNFAQNDNDPLTKQNELSGIETKKVKEQIPLLQNVAVRELEEIQRQLQEVKGKETQVD